MVILEDAISPVLDPYDYVLIDCPPNLGFITRNGIEISDYYLIPTIPDTLSTYGVPQIIKTIQSFIHERPEELRIECMGLLITKFSSNSASHREKKRTLPARFRGMFEELEITPAPVFDTVMPQANATAEAMEFDNNPSSFKEKYGRSRSGKKYLYEYVIELTREFIAKIGGFNF